MNHGFVKCAAASTPVRVADCAFHAEETVKAIRAAAGQSVRILVLPGAGPDRLYLRRPLPAEDAAGRRAGSPADGPQRHARPADAGLRRLPLAVDGKLYNWAPPPCSTELSWA